MGKTLEEMLDALPPERRRRIEARGRELIEEEYTLQELRRAMGATQVQLARRLGKPQAAISRIEAQSDMLMSTLAEVVEGLGGRIKIVAELPGRRPVSIALLGDLGTQPPPDAYVPPKIARKGPAKSASASAKGATPAARVAAKRVAV